MKDSVRCKRVTFYLWIDTEEYTDPKEWKLNEIFGFTGISSGGATITRPDYEDLGRGIDILAERKKCRQQTT